MTSAFLRLAYGLATLDSSKTNNEQPTTNNQLSPVPMDIVSLLYLPYDCHCNYLQKWVN